jgi:hypothetical protein
LISLKFEKPTTFEIKPLSLFLTGDIKDNPAVIDKPVVPVEASETPVLNDVLRKLSGREYQGLMRIIREYNKEKINREQAIQMLKSAYGLTDEECSVWLGEE